MYVYLTRECVTLSLALYRLSIYLQTPSKKAIKSWRLNSFETAFGNCDSAHRRAHPPESEWGFWPSSYITAGTWSNSLTLREQRETVLERKSDNRLLWTNHAIKKLHCTIYSRQTEMLTFLWSVASYYVKMYFSLPRPIARHYLSNDDVRQRWRQYKIVVGYSWKKEDGGRFPTPSPLCGTALSATVMSSRTQVSL